MPRNQSRTIVQKYRDVIVMLSLDLQHGGGRKVFEEYTPFNFRLHDIVIHVVAEAGVRRE